MADIKTKKNQEISIKKLDRATIMGQNLKSNIVNVKEKQKKATKRTKTQHKNMQEIRYKEELRIQQIMELEKQIK